MASINGAPVSVEQLEAFGLVNYGHFTSFQVEEGTVRGLSHHLDRLVSDCRTVFGVELDPVDVRDCIRGEVVRAGRDSLGMRVTIFDPGMSLAAPAKSPTPHILVSVRPAAASGPLPPLRARSARYLRELPLVKHVSLFGSLTQRREAQGHGFDDALFVDQSGFISEGPTWNIGFFDGHQVIWPSADVLPGVTMRLLKQVHEEFLSTPVNIGDVPHMRAAFATNVTIGVRAIGAIDDVALPVDAEIVKILRSEYEEIPGEEI